MKLKIFLQTTFSSALYANMTFFETVTVKWRLYYCVSTIFYTTSVSLNLVQIVQEDLTLVSPMVSSYKGDNISSFRDITWTHKV